MTNEEAYKKAQEELEEAKVKRIKGFMKDLLQAIQLQQEKKQDAEEKIRILKLDLDDLRKGNLEKIEERHKASKKAEEVSPLKTPIKFNDLLAGSNLIYGMPAVTYTSGNALLGGNTDTIFGDGTVGYSISSTTTSSVDDKGFYNEASSGTYTVLCGNGTTKTYYF